MAKEEPRGASAGSAAAPGRAGSRNPFTSPRFLRWWIASVVAGTGVGIQTVTVPLFIRDRVATDARAAAIAAALIAQTAPAALTALFGGALADRMARRRILAGSYLVAAVVSLGYVLLAGLDVRKIWPVFPLAAVVGSAGAFTNPARQSMRTQIVTRAQLQNSVIFGTMGFMATLQFVGPALGGLVTEFRGLTEAFTLEVVLLGAAAYGFAGINAPVPKPSGRNVLGDLVAGLHYVLEERSLLYLLLLGAIPGIFFVSPFAVTVPIMVPDVLHASDKWVGLLWGCFGGGVFVGSLVLSIRPVPRRGLAVCLSTLLGGLILTSYGLSKSLALSATVLVIWGLCASIFINYVIALLQEHTREDMMGRVMSMYSLAFFLSLPIGYAQAGFFATRLGPATTIVLSGTFSAALGLACTLFLAPVRRLS